jgi:hypothetical protein
MNGGLIAMVALMRIATERAKPSNRWSFLQEVGSVESAIVARELDLLLSQMQ